MKRSKLLRAVVLILAVVFVFGSWLFSGEENDFDSVSFMTVQAQSVFDSGTTEDPTPDSADSDSSAALDEHGVYDQKDDVALFIRTYNRLPDNYISKQEAQNAGWSGGNVEEYCPGKCIGGSRFGNYEGLLPEKDGREWTECDINTLSAPSRGAERIVFSNDGLIYYTADHYASFELLYGEP